MTTMINTGNGRRDYSQVAYRLATIKELIGTPEDAQRLSRDVYSGLRIMLEEAAEYILAKGDGHIDRQGYKLLMVASLVDMPEQAEDIPMDVWSGIRMHVEDVAEYLLNIETPQAC